jgi:hypothetical protein
MGTCVDFAINGDQLRPGFAEIVRTIGNGLYDQKRSSWSYRFTPVLPGRCAGNSLLPFPYDEVTDESPPPGAAKQRVPG